MTFAGLIESHRKNEGEDSASIIETSIMQKIAEGTI